MNQHEIAQMNLRFRTLIGYVRLLTGNPYWISALLVLIFSVGLLSISLRDISPPLASKSINESQSFIPTMVPTNAPPIRVKPTGPPQPVPLPPRPANLSLFGVGLIIVVSMLALVIMVINAKHAIKGFPHLTTSIKLQ